MPRTITVRLLDGEKDSQSQIKIIAAYQLPEASIRRFPESLLGDALDGSSSQDGCVYHAEAKGQPGGITLSFYNRPAVVFDTAMQVITRGGLEGVNLAPLGSSVDAVLEELAGFWKLPFTMDDIHRAFRPSMVHHIHLMVSNDAKQLWSTLQHSTMAALSGKQRCQLLNDGCAVFAIIPVATQANGAPAGVLRGRYSVQLINDTFITGPLTSDWDRCVQDGQLVVQWTDHNMQDGDYTKLKKLQCSVYMCDAGRPLGGVCSSMTGRACNRCVASASRARAAASCAACGSRRCGTASSCMLWTWCSCWMRTAACGRGLMCRRCTLWWCPGEAAVPARLVRQLCPRQLAGFANGSAGGYRGSCLAAPESARRPNNTHACARQQQCTAVLSRRRYPVRQNGHKGFVQCTVSCVSTDVW